MTDPCQQGRYFCPRLLDYILIVGSRHPNRNNMVAQTPELLRRYPLEDHQDFGLAPDVVFFCQPEGCISVGPKRTGLRESTSFVFTLTEKDSGRTRYGMCLNFYRPFEKRIHGMERNKAERHTSIASTASTSSGEQSSLGVPTAEGGVRPRSPRTRRRQKMAGRVRNHTLTSLCIISHHPFFSTFRECLSALRKIIEACNERSCSRRVGASKSSARDTVWGIMTGQGMDSTPSLVMHEVREIETWILRLLSAPVPVPGKTRVEVTVLPPELQPPLVFALPDHTRFSLIDFPLHLPLELLGVEMCLKVLCLIMLENKLILQSRDQNALSMSVMAFVSMLYPLEYMFPVIPLLPTCMSAAEQLLLAPTPFIIGVPSSFLMYKKNFPLPDDVWLVDLDSNRISGGNEELPALPEPEGTVLKNHLKQVLDVGSSWYESQISDQGIALASMSMSPQPIKNLDTLTQNPELWKRRESFSSQLGFNPLIYGNDVDSVDVATRVAMVRFFNSPNVLGNFAEHTRTLRLYPRPVVAFQLNSFMKSRPVKTVFTAKLARTQAVEYFAEWALCPSNVVFLRVQTGVYDPLLIGDKAKWYSQSLQKIDFQVYDEPNSTLGAAVSSCLDLKTSDEENPTDESGSDSEGAESTSSSYSSLSDFVIDIQNSDINGETPDIYPEDQVLTIDEASVYQPPNQLQVPDAPMSNSDSALSAPDSDDGDSSDSSYAKDPVGDSDRSPSLAGGTPLKADGDRFRYDTLHHAGAKQREDSSQSRGGSTPEMQRRATVDKPPSSPSLRSADSAFDSATQSSPGGTPTPFRRHASERDSNRSRSSSGSSTPKIPPQRPPPPSPAALGRAMSLQGQSPPVMSSQGQSVAGQGQGQGQLQHSQPPPPPAQQGQGQTQAMAPSQGQTQIQGHGQGQGHGRGHLHAQQSLHGSMRPTAAPTASASGNSNPSDVDKGSIIASITDEINGYAQTASNTISELFAKGKQPQQPPQKGTDEFSTVSDLSDTGTSKSTSSAPTTKSVKPFAPLGNRKALVEKSGLVKHATHRKKKELQRQQSVDHKPNSHGENQHFLKDIISNVLDGQGVGWLKVSRVKKLMEDENYRNFVVSRLNTSLDKKLAEDDLHCEDVCVNKSVFKGMLTVVKALVLGLENTYQNNGIGGMASVFMVLEIIHTHYWEKDGGSNKSDTSNPSVTSSPFGSRESLSSMTADSKVDSHSLQEEHMVAALGHTQGWRLEPPSGGAGGLYATSSSSGTTESGSPVVLNGDEYENIELRRADDVNLPDKAGVSSPCGDNNGPRHGADPRHRDLDNNNRTLEHSGGSSSLESNRNLTNAALSSHQQSSLISNDPAGMRDSSSGYGSESGDMLRDMVKNKELMRGPRRKNLPKYSSVESDISEGSTLMSIRRKRLGSMLSIKSHLSTGFRYHEGRMLNLNLPSPETNRTYLFEHVIGKERSWLWDQMQFWEDAFLDVVAQERDIIGMDQGPGEMMERYNSLGDMERKRLEYDEDKLLSVLLYNMVAFMVMMRVSKNEVRRKVRRLVGKCHVGLACSQDINNVLDQINNLHGNDIDLRPMGSRMMQKQSFTVHWGPDNTGDMLFMEVCDDCLILRSVTSTICDRWWYEKLVNMTYCPKTKVLCLWRKHDGKTQLNKFYTRKCKELYLCVKDAMEKAAARNIGKMPGPELGGEFPVQDLRTGQGGLLQVCMEGIGLLFANSKDFEFFIELSRIKKCFTQRGGIFVLEEFDPKTRKVTQRKYKSSMASTILLAFHRLITVHPGFQKKSNVGGPGNKNNNFKHVKESMSRSSSQGSIGNCSTLSFSGSEFGEIPIEDDREIMPNFSVGAT